MKYLHKCSDHNTSIKNTTEEGTCATELRSGEDKKKLCVIVDFYLGA